MRDLIMSGIDNLTDEQIADLASDGGIVGQLARDELRENGHEVLREINNGVIVTTVRLLGNDEEE